MRLRTITRFSAIGTAASVAIASWLTFVAPAASALEKEGLVITQDEVVEAVYGPVVGNNPAGSAHGPEECRVSAYCDAIPLEVIVPDSVTEEDEFFIQVLVEWETGRAPGDPVLEPEGYTLNDMDMYIYTDPGTPEEAEARGHTPNSTGDPYVARGASGSTPEQAFLFKPRGRYWINIVNYLGSNTGYSVKLTWVSEAFPSPFEALAPEFKPTTTTTSSTTTTTTTTIAPPPVADMTSPTLAPLEVVQDDDFDLSQFDSDFEDELAAPAPLSLTPIASTPKSPSSAALFFWLLAVPLAMVAVGGSLILRNRATI